MSHSPIPVLGISRSHRFSPNSTGRDEAIFMAVASRMERKGFDVSIISEDLFVAVDLEEFKLVFSMARSMDVLKALAEAERNGILKVVNSAECLLANTRDVIAKRFAQNDVPQPLTIALDTSTTTSSSILSSLHLPLWLKRADACAQSPLDVQFIDSHEALEKGLVHFRENNIDRIVAVERNENGTLVSVTTKGDNNDLVDGGQVSRGTIIAVYTGSKIPALGKVLGFLSTQVGFGVCILLPLILFFIYQLVKFVMAFMSVKNSGKKVISAADEELIRQKAVEEYLKKQQEKENNNEEIKS